MKASRPWDILRCNRKIIGLTGSQPLSALLVPPPFVAKTGGSDDSPAIKCQKLQRKFEIAYS